MTPPPKSQTVGQIHAAKLRHEGTNQSLVLNYRDWMSGATSGRGRNIFLDILFIERNQAFSQACAFCSSKTMSVSAIAIFHQPMDHETEDDLLVCGQLRADACPV